MTKRRKVSKGDLLVFGENSPDRGVTHVVELFLVEKVIGGVIHTRDSLGGSSGMNTDSPLGALWVHYKPKDDGYSERLQVFKAELEDWEASVTNDISATKTILNKFIN